MIIGVIGGGQLGRMLALAGYHLGMRFRFYDSAPDAPAGQVGPLTVGAFEDLPGLARWASGADDGSGEPVDVVTFEFENVPVASAEHLAQRYPVWPPPRALAESQDRLREKTLFRRLGIPTPDFEPVGTKQELARALERLGLPAVLKTRRMGYDGKGQAVLRETGDVDRAWQAVGGGSMRELILEQFVRFDREVSILAVRGVNASSGGRGTPAGRTAFYPLVANTHEGGILHTSVAPAPDAAGGVQAIAQQAATAVMDALGYAGLLTIEWFQVGDRLLANEMAPRVHNSGHWTIEGSACSQFENHLRAITGLPLGATEMRCPDAVAGMVNLIGRAPDLAELATLPRCHPHLYGKSPRAGRKIGHITLIEHDEQTLNTRLAELARRVAPPR